MTTKFNKDMYARMRGKKDEPLSALGTKSVRITDKGANPGGAHVFSHFGSGEGCVPDPVNGRGSSMQ